LSETVVSLRIPIISIHVVAVCGAYCLARESTLLLSDCLSIILTVY